MIYILTIIILLFLVFHYDVNGNTKNKMIAYYLLMAWFIAVSGFQYRMGSDIKVYMIEFEDAEWFDLSLDNFSFFSERQFGWTLLINLTKSLSGDFTILKMIQSIIVNYAVFRFLFKYCKMFFTAIFFYSIYIYLEFNFNVLRQSISIAFFLFSYQYLIEKKWIKYYLSVFIALMFHNTAIVLVFLPLVSLINIDVNKIGVISILLLSLLVLLNFTGILNNIDIQNILLPELYDQGSVYFEDDNYGSNSGYFLQFFFVSLVYILVSSFLFIRGRYENKLDIMMFYIYLIFLSLNSKIPIFSRLNLFFIPFYICLLATFVHEFPYTYFEKKISKLLIMVFVVLFSYIPINSLFKINPVTGKANIVQFYPYYTIFDPKVSEDRESF